MKNMFLFVAGIVTTLSFSACNSNHHDDNKPYTQPVKNGLGDSGSTFIPADTANKMLGSYLSSINYLHNDSDLQSLTIDVKQLRRYIDSMPASPTITGLKLMFAHTLAYANSSRVNTSAGYLNYGLTLIIAAYDASGNYIFYNGSEVLDYASPCPPVCPPGNAGNPFLVTLQKK